MAQQYDQLLAAPRPFVKWAGGKRQLIRTIEERLPGKFGAYFEPFVGGGAVLFHILTLDPRRRCYASDLNSDLVLAYTTIRDRVDELISSLKKHERGYARDPARYYYAQRAASPRGQIEKASRLLFLNRTCFNGLYRVNSKGRFNVPLGRYTNPNIVNEEGLRAVSAALKPGIDISCRDFAAVLDHAKKGDLVYFDPPYQPVSRTANFTSYTSRDFTTDDLQRLADVCHKLDSRGCHVMLSNSDSPEVAGMFSGRPWRIARISAKRAINSDSAKRTGHTELLITNYRAPSGI